MMPNHNSLDPEIALRIALAAKVLNIEVSQFVVVLIKAIGTPLTPQRLAKLRLNRLRISLDRSVSILPLLSPQQLTQCLELLKGRGLPKIVETDINIQSFPIEHIVDSIRIAFTCNSNGQLDAGFNDCKFFLIYQVSSQQSTCIAVRSVFDIELNGSNQIVHKFHAKDQRLNHRVAQITDCIILYTLSIGGQASAKVIKAGVMPIKVQAQSIHTLLCTLQLALNSPSPWLVRAMQKQHTHHLSKN